MKTKKLGLFTPVIFALSALTGCGGGGDSDKIVIDFWHTFGDIPETALLDKAAEFEALVQQHEGKKVSINATYQGGYSEMPKKVTNGMGNGDLPTMVIAYADHVATYMDKEGNTPGKFVVNLDSYINNSELTFGTDEYLDDTHGVDDIIESYLDEGKHMMRSGTYLLPYMKSTEIMTYNLDVAQVVVPKVFTSVLANQVEDFMKTITWDQLMQIAQYIVDNKSTYTSVEYPVYYDSDANLFITELYQRGIPYSSIDDQGVGNIDFASGEALTNAKAMVSELREQHKNGLFTTKGAEGTYASNNFKQRKTIFTIGSTGGTGYTLPMDNSFNVGFCQVPAMSNDSSKRKYISQGPSICFLRNPSLSEETNATKLKYAWKFAKYLLSSDVNAELCCTGSQGYSPVRTSCYSSEAYLDYITRGDFYSKAMITTQTEVAGNYFNSAVFVGSATLREQSGAIITEALKYATSKTIDEIFTAAINEANKNIKTND